MTTQVLSQYIIAQLTYLSMAIKQHAKPFLDGRNLTKVYTPELLNQDETPEILSQLVSRLRQLVMWYHSHTASSVIYLDSSWMIYLVGDLGVSWGNMLIIWWAKQNAVGGKTSHLSFHSISCSISTRESAENELPTLAPSFSISSVCWGGGGVKTAPRQEMIREILIYWLLTHVQWPWF